MAGGATVLLPALFRRSCCRGRVTDERQQWGRECRWWWRRRSGRGQLLGARGSLGVRVRDGPRNGGGEFVPNRSTDKYREVLPQRRCCCFRCCSVAAHDADADAAAGISIHSEWHLTSPLVAAESRSFGRIPHRAHTPPPGGPATLAPPLPPPTTAMTEKKVDRVPRPDWSFKVFPFPGGYAACVARGPPSACSPSGQAAGVISDPDAPQRGQSLPQLRFRRVTLEEVVPRDVAARLLGRGL